MEKEMEIVKNYIEAVTNEEVRDLDAVLREWRQAKSQYLFKVFKDELILTKPVKIKKPYIDTSREMSKVSSSYFHFFYDKRKNGEDDGFCEVVIQCFEIPNLVSNTYLGSKVVLHHPNDPAKKYVVMPGAKVMKILRKLAEWYDIPEYEEMRLAHSMVLNDSYLEGELCLSIHPMDYLTMSDNENNWHSCMSYLHEGGYKVGTVEMMNSPCVVVAYLRDPHKELHVGQDVVWNSKQWRTLFVVDNDIIVNVKNYPYHSDELTFQCLDWLRDLMTEAGYNYYPNVMYYSYEDSSTVTDDEAPEEMKLDNRNWFAFNFDTCMMYNDFENSSDNACYVNSYLPYEAQRTINYSGDATCLSCGRYLDADDSPSFVFCSYCEERVYCEDCGELLMVNDYIEMDYEKVDGCYLCECCFKQAVKRGDILYCEDDGDYHYGYNTYYVHDDEDGDFCLSNAADIEAELKGKNYTVEDREIYVIYPEEEEE